MSDPKNLKAPLKRVHHSDLKRLNEDSAYKSECPSCDDGLLLIRREGGILQRYDMCLVCGQRVFYLDSKINGEPLAGNPPN